MIKFWKAFFCMWFVFVVCT